jgi:hypothetical protein
MRLIALALIATSLWGQSITWTRTYVQGSPQVEGTPNWSLWWNKVFHDPLSGKMTVWTNNGGIYATRMYFWDTTGHTWSRIAGTGVNANACSFDTATMPGERHPQGYMTLDTRRNRLYVFGGVNQACNADYISTNGTAATYAGGASVNDNYPFVTTGNWVGGTIIINGVDYTIASVTDSTHLTLTTSAGVQTGVVYSFPSPNVSPRRSMHYLNLNATETSSSWVQVTGSNVPNGLVTGAAVYDPVDDIHYMRGYVYCVENADSAIRTKQIAAGCVTPEVWQTITESGTSPTALTFFDMIYDPETEKIIYYGGMDGGLSTSYNGTYAYDVPTKTWTQKCAGGCTPPPVYAGGYVATPAWAYNTRDKKIYYRTVGTTSGAPKDYTYDPVADVWTELTSSGDTQTWSNSGETMGYDPVSDKLMRWKYDPNNAFVEVWEAQLDSPPVGATGQFRITGSWPSGNAKWLKVCGIVPSLSAGSTATVTLTGPGGLSVPLTVQEALYPGSMAGIARTDEPFCMGVPVADSAAITSTTGLALTGAGTPAEADIATDNGSTITVDTGAAVFTIKEANYNVLDSVVVDGTTVVASSVSATRGLVLLGPNPAGTYPANVTCDATGSDCTTVYSSANDASSSCAIEENGPVMAVVRCIGTHKDASANPYMQFTARTYFYKGKAGVKVMVTLRNANYDTTTPSPDKLGGTFNTAHKGMKSYELRLGANITGTLDYTIATDATDQTGTLDQSGGTDEAYIYQGQSSWMTAQESGPLCPNGSDCANAYFTTDAGWSAKKNSTTLDSGTVDEYIKGYADIRNSSGVGIQAGIYQMSAYWPTSIEFTSGGAEVRLGLWSARSSMPHYTAWTGWEIKEVFLNFHDAAVSSLGDEFLKFQHYLLARAPYTYYNATGAFPYPMISAEDEDAFYVSLDTTANPDTIPRNVLCYGGGSTNCTPDRSTNDYTASAKSMALGVYRKYYWNDSGSLNQMEFRWGDSLRYLQRGQSGRWLNSAHFYRYLAEKTMIHSDGGSATDSAVNGFLWSDRPHLNEVDGLGYPVAYSNIGNTAKAYLDGIDYLHDHWTGILDYYFMTGEEWVKESIMSRKFWYLNLDTYQNGSGGGLENGRAYAMTLTNASRFKIWLDAIGDGDAAGVLTSATTIYGLYVNKEGCANGYPVGCTPPSLDLALAGEPQGFSYERGLHQSFRGQRYCAGNAGTASSLQGYYRFLSAFIASQLAEGLIEYGRAAGGATAVRARDLAYGLGQFATIEIYNDDGSGMWSTANPKYNGFRYSQPIDMPGKCPEGTLLEAGNVSADGNIYDTIVMANSTHNMYFAFYALLQSHRTVDWQGKMKVAMQKAAYYQNPWPSDFGMYSTWVLIDAINNPPADTLTNVAFGVTNNGGGSYTLTWTPPADATAAEHRIKWSTRRIAPSNALLGFDSLDTNAFTLSPDTYQTWFSAADAGEPTCSSTCSITITGTGDTGLTEPNFSVMAFTTEDAPETPSGASGRTNGAGRANGGAKIQ